MVLLEALYARFQSVVFVMEVQEPSLGSPT